MGAKPFGAIIALMAKAWLLPQDQGRPESGQLRLVFNQSEAAEMNNANAQQTMRAATTSYPDYTWAMVEVRQGVFVVEGDKK